jgi:hypothetical protein
MSSDEPDSIPPAGAESEKKKKKRSLRVGQTAEERSYADSKDALLRAARLACQTLEQKDAAFIKKDEGRKYKRELAEQLQKEKREARLERSQARKQKLADAASSTLHAKKKLMKEGKQKKKD